MKKKKEITIAAHHRGRCTKYTGTIEYLENEVFGYTLECGNAWNSKIPRYPKGAKSLVKALNDSKNETQGGCYERDWYELVED